MKSSTTIIFPTNHCFFIFYLWGVDHPLGYGHSCAGTGRDGVDEFFFGFWWESSIDLWFFGLWVFGLFFIILLFILGELLGNLYWFWKGLEEFCLVFVLTDLHKKGKNFYWKWVSGYLFEGLLLLWWGLFFEECFWGEHKAFFPLRCFTTWFVVYFPAVSLRGAQDSPVWKFSLFPKAQEKKKRICFLGRLFGHFWPFLGAFNSKGIINSKSKRMRQPLVLPKHHKGKWLVFPWSSNSHQRKAQRATRKNEFRTYYIHNNYTTSVLLKS